MKKRFSRKLLVDPHYQFLQVAAIVVGNLLVALLIAGLLSWFYLLVWDGAVVVNHNQTIPVYVAIAALAVTMVTVYFSLRRSRVIAGMMKKIHRVLDEAAQGQLPDGCLTFRKGDSFQQVAEPLNRCLELMRKAHSNPILREQVQGVLAEIDGGADLDLVRCRLSALLDQKPSGRSSNSVGV